ncbi:hypothetical protein M431DRAFT_424714 [Trichoderma harzianum CBS 226.95]|uniref:Uncharacterized protein n=1 Tax=Trichoderma harzianum CBS 226.95 TaxID=983964 RepID=A0A2T4AC06_TRIHA|nr:hypothetical protein M431DRAFT_424714 [Trichoderma harzianum CBS 226.95]PTB54609.1 hypothetical protein M431DRAFT_424714 [Trichoderma harzianum CBS 226.95]
MAAPKVPSSPRTVARMCQDLLITWLLAPIAAVLITAVDGGFLLAQRHSPWGWRWRLKVAILHDRDTKYQGLSRPPQSPPPLHRVKMLADAYLETPRDFGISRLKRGKRTHKKRGPECYCIMSRHDSPKYNLTKPFEQVEISIGYVRSHTHRICVRMIVSAPGLVVATARYENVYVTGGGPAGIHYVIEIWHIGS